MLPRISVIIRAYNPNEWLFEALESVFDQDYDGVVEVVLCYDSASRTSDVLEKLRSVESSDRRLFKLVVHEHMSPTTALFECGFREASSDYITVLDYDNLYPKDYIRRVVERIDGKDFVFTNPMLMDATGRVLGIRAHRIPKKINFESLTAYNVCDANGLILSRKAVEILLEYYDKVLRNSSLIDLVHEDYFIALVLSTHFNPLYIDDVYPLYRVHERHQTWSTEPVSISQTLIRDIITLYTVFRALEGRLSLKRRFLLFARMFRKLLTSLFYLSGAILPVSASFWGLMETLTRYIKCRLRRT